MTLDEWMEKYKPRKMVLRAGLTDLMAYCYDCHQDWHLVKEYPANVVWTLLYCDGKRYLGQGFHHVNREAYLIATVPEFGTVDDVCIDDDDDDSNDNLPLDMAQGFAIAYAKKKYAIDDDTFIREAVEDALDIGSEMASEGDCQDLIDEMAEDYDWDEVKA